LYKLHIVMRKSKSKSWGTNVLLPMVCCNHSYNDLASPFLMISKWRTLLHSYLTTAIFETTTPINWKHWKDYPSATGSLHDDSADSFLTMAQHCMRLRQPLKNYEAIRKLKKTLCRRK
jgi:hypothetical protein